MRFDLTLFLIGAIFLPVGCGQVRQEATTTSTKSGAIFTNERWSGTVAITGDVTIYSGVVTIEPGTTVIFTADSDDRAGGSTTLLCAR